MSQPDPKCCHIEIKINSQGNVNIYNCPAPEGQKPCVDTGDAGQLPTSPGACIPLALGSKPKQSQQHKFEKLLANNPVPSSLAAMFIQSSRRFLAGRTAANPFEEGVFSRLRQLSPSLKRTLSCTLGQFDDVPGEIRAQLFDTELIGDLDTPLDHPRLLKALTAEITHRATLAYAEPDCVTERPGEIRVFDPGPGEFFESQVRICRINTLRTQQYRPALNISDFTPSELQQKCVPQDVNGEIQVNCAPQKGNCPGHMWSDTTCLRVQEVEAGQAVLLEGVNFFSVDTKVRLTLKDSGNPPREVDAHICGDQDTPVNEVVNGETVLINDCRVHDRLTFYVPADLPHGVYEVYVAVPNITGIPALGDPILSTVEYICVLPPNTARFRIEGDKMRCHDETSPTWPGSDEVAIRFLTTGIRTDGTFCELEYVEALFGDVDSGETRNLTCVPLPEYDQPLSAVTMVIIGYEVDDWDAYVKQINTFADAYVDFLKYAWKAILANAAIDVVIAILASSGWPLIIAAAGTLLLAAIGVVFALWAPADLIIHDAVTLSACDLAALTDDAFPAPPSAQYNMPGDIKVKATTEQKGGNQYLERREYKSEDEDSRYSITLLYSRVA